MAIDTTIVGLYDDFSDAKDAVEELIGIGYQPENISIVTSDEDGRYKQYIDRMNLTPPGDKSDSDTEKGAVLGAVMGTLTGFGIALVPGIGPVFAAGPFAAALIAGIGAATGAATGGFLEMLMNTGMDEATGSQYAEGVRRGGTLVVVQAHGGYDDHVESILENHHPVDISERARTWKQEGWTHFDDTQPPYTQDEIPAEVERKLGAAPTEIDLEKGLMRVSRYQVSVDEVRKANEAANRPWTEEDFDERFSENEAHFREHFDKHYAGTDYTYAQVRPAYRYGFLMVDHPIYHDSEWEHVEPEFRSAWDAETKGAWSKVRGAVLSGWEYARGKERYGV